MLWTMGSLRSNLELASVANSARYWQVSQRQVLNTRSSGFSCHHSHINWPSLSFLELFQTSLIRGQFIPAQYYVMNMHTHINCRSKYKYHCNCIYPINKLTYFYMTTPLIRKIRELLHPETGKWIIPLTELRISCNADFWVVVTFKRLHWPEN